MRVGRVDECGKREEERFDFWVGRVQVGGVRCEGCVRDVGCVGCVGCVWGAGRTYVAFFLSVVEEDVG